MTPHAHEQLTSFEKMWRRHTICSLGQERFLIHIDRHMVHEGSSAEAFDMLKSSGRRLRNPELTFGVVDHVVSTMPGRTADSSPPGRARIKTLIENCAQFNVSVFDLGSPNQGIAHVVAPELGIALPGTTLTCGDSHTATCGGIGAMAWGIGTTEVGQVLVGQSLIVKKPKAMRVNFRGHIGRGVYAKDMILHLIGKYGVAAATGHAIEYAGAAIRSLPIEGRMTICNMSIEFGARTGFVTPDDATFDYVGQRPLAPKGALWERALADWASLKSDEDAQFDTELAVDCDTIAPHISWGTSPQDVIGVDGRLPFPNGGLSPQQRDDYREALTYMGLEPGQALAGLPVDIAFIGSCTNGRLSDLIAAAEVVKNRHVAEGVRALVVPGSMKVKADAERMGLDRIFVDAGFEWRNAGCSMCVAANEDVVPPGKRCISTSNRNFENRQGKGSRTHLASPAMVAAAAVSGKIVDIRQWGNA